MTLEHLFIELHLLKGDGLTYELSCDGVPMGLCRDAQYTRYLNAFGMAGVEDRLCDPRALDEYFQSEWTFTELTEDLQARTEEDLNIREESIRYWRRFKSKAMGKGQ